MRAFVFVFVTLQSMAVASASDCAALLKGGVFDMSESAESLHTSKSFGQWFCQQRFSSQSAAKSFSAGGTEPFSGLALEINANKSESSWRQSRDSYCERINSNEDLQNMTKVHVSKASPVIANAFVACTNAVGLHFWPEYTFDKKTFYIAAKLTPLIGDNYREKVRLLGSDNIKCTEFEPVGAVQRVRCTRTNYDAASVSLNIDSSSKYPIASGSTVNIPSVGIPCSEFVKRDPQNYGCSTRTETGFFWRKVKKISNYYESGFQWSLEPKVAVCGLQTAGTFSETVKYPPAHGLIFDELFTTGTIAHGRGLEHNNDVKCITQTAPDGTTKVKPGLEGLDLRNICGRFSFRCEEQPY